MTLATAAISVDRDPRRNGRAILAAMRQAKAGGARMVHFCEGAASGYAKSEVSGWEGYPWEVLRQTLLEIGEQARRLSLWTVVGAAHRLTAPNAPHNCLYVFSPDGRLAGRYDKRFCSNSELKGWYSPGGHPLLFKAGALVFGCALCIELQFPEVFADYAAAGADCVLVSSYSGNSFFLTLAQAHAELYGLWVSLSEPLKANGGAGAALIGPDGSLLAQTSAGVVTCDLCPEDGRWEIPLRRARPWRQKARAGGIYRGPWQDDPRSLDRDSF